MTDSKEGMYKVKLKYIVPEIKEVLKNGWRCAKVEASLQGLPMAKSGTFEYKDNNEYWIKKNPRIQLLTTNWWDQIVNGELTVENHNLISTM